MRTEEAVAAMPCPICRTGLALSDRRGVEEGLRAKPTPFRNMLGMVCQASFLPRPSAGIPDVPPQQRAVDDLVKRVRKLRWMGFEDEAIRLERLLHKRAAGGGRLGESNGFCPN